MFDLSGRQVFVTGAGGAIGAAIVKAFNTAGSTVIGADIAEGKANFPLNVIDDCSWDMAAAYVQDKFGCLDVLVNCAGFAPTPFKLEDLDIEIWRRTMAVNVEGVALGMKAMLPLLRQAEGRFKGGPSVVNIASAAASFPSPFNSAYACSKAAVAMLSKVAAVEFSTLQYGIRVNSVHPGSVTSKMMDTIIAGAADKGGTTKHEQFEAMLERCLVKRFAEPDEVAAAVVYVASSECGYMHGSEIHLDGGLLIS